MELYITLNELRRPKPLPDRLAFPACRDGYRKLLSEIEYDETADVVRIPIKLIMETNDVYDAEWAVHLLGQIGVISREVMDEADAYACDQVPCPSTEEQDEEWHHHYLIEVLRLAKRPADDEERAF